MSSAVQRLLIHALSLVNNPLGSFFGRPREPSCSFDWSSIEPSKQLKWHACYERQECARLAVPMDYDNPSLHESVAVAVIRDPANVSRSDPSYGGSIFLNPGGPGGSGVDFLRWAAYETHTKISGPNQFDLISWDPRGVENTTPRPECFASELDRRVYWLKQQTIGGVSKSDDNIHYGLAAAEAFGQACNDTIIRYMTTYLAVKDMLAIADALEPDVSAPLINYWGISYGTFLGNTFASAFPERIGRVILDGVVSSDEFLSSHWSRNLLDTGRALQHLYNWCHLVGPSRCAIHDSSPARVQAKIDAFLTRLAASPMPMYDPAERRADVLTATPVEKLIVMALYFPHQRFARLAEALHDVMQSPPKTALIAAMVESIVEDPRSTQKPSIIRPSNESWSNAIPPGRFANNEDIERMIACSDGNPINDWDTTDFKSYVQTLVAYSPMAVDFWARTTLTCTRWPTSNRAPEHVRFTGSFGSKLQDYNTKRGARPLLFIGNEADPVTPYEAATIESSRHEGSVVLKTKIYGHASVPLNPSKCVWDVMRQYWNHGELPANGTVCEEDEWK